MFKSIFAKYVTAFMVIIAGCFALLLLIVTSIVGNYSMQNKAAVMENSADLIRMFLEEKAEDCAPERFTQMLAETDAERLRAMLDSFSDFGEDISVLLTDSNGTVLYAAGAASELSEGETALPMSVLSAVSASADGGFFGRTELTDNGREVLLCAVPVCNAQGTLCGIAAVYSEQNTAGGLDVENNLTKTILSSAALVLIAALIAAYIITERTVAPIREMSVAARDFAAGKFESRVTVRGRDEVSQLAEAFNQMADSLENLEKMRNSFVANVSHDLRTPMTTIAGFIDGIRDGVIPPEECDHYLEIVSIEVHRLSRLVSSLLDLSRIQAGDRKFVMKSFDICEMARLILISFEHTIEEKKLEVVFDCESDRMPVLADHDAIYQIFYNICHNALKFSKEGGLLRIRILTAKDKKIQVSVYNEGNGIPTEDQPYVFERFYKSDKSRGLDKTGVGLGLYIAKTIIAAHGEKIWVESEPGKNCEFFFTLPRAPHHILHAAEDKTNRNSVN